MSQKDGSKDGAPEGPKDKGSTPFSAKPCPICAKPSVERYHPFCSKRCADIDLNRWLSGTYAIPGRDEEDDDGSASPPERS